MAEKDPHFQSGKLVKDKLKGYYGTDFETSLQSVNFATTDTPLLSEHDQEDTKELE